VLRLSSIIFYLSNIISDLLTLVWPSINAKLEDHAAVTALGGPTSVSNAEYPVTIVLLSIVGNQLYGYGHVTHFKWYNLNSKLACLDIMMTPFKPPATDEGGPQATPRNSSTIGIITFSRRRVAS